MNEQHDRLRETVSELEAELAALDSVDDETRRVLETALAEITEVLQRQERAEAERPHSLVERLEDAAKGLESSHPNLFGILRRTVNALGQMGI
jgi:phytoene/squalene synthetase